MPSPGPATSKGQTDRADIPRRHRAWRSPVACIVFALIAAAGAVADLASKQCVFSDLLADPNVVAEVRQLRQEYGPQLTAHEMLRRLRISRPVCPGVSFTLSTNPGVVFGLPVPRPAVAAATVLAIALVAGIFALSSRKAHWLHVALALVLAGALGNFYDRLVSRVQLPVEGLAPIAFQVRDFIDCSSLYYPWVFNIADVFLVVGVGILMIQWMRPVKKNS